MKRTINADLVVRQLKEVREELEQIEFDLSRGRIDDDVLRARFQQAYHHLNVAWNARCVTPEKWGSLTDDDFNSWSRRPRDIPPLRIETPKRVSRTRPA